MRNNKDNIDEEYNEKKNILVDRQFERIRLINPKNKDNRMNWIEEMLNWN